MAERLLPYLEAGELESNFVKRRELGEFLSDLLLRGIRVIGHTADLDIQDTRLLELSRHILQSDVLHWKESFIVYHRYL